MSWTTRIATLSKGVGPFALTINGAPVTINGSVVTIGAPYA
ncbi:hypothetical protein HOS13_gp48 [Caulobacter phage Lullwater]|uniref:Uncharacterized protein n=1 Tax=Caulobacter phage Lullwater TaxID=2024607 RepID=A0A291LBD0_9CAUD|nr:hypothetical protein HOS13_gp48 [Caulobacter phage Lullwater]ATI16355.1 hypothetical protein Lull_048 [Caulobacter phage Lullwater]